MEPSLRRPPVAAALVYEGRHRSDIVEWKFHGRTGATREFAAAIVRTFDGAPWIDDLDVVTWAPTTESRRRRRGFDQAELLARSVSRRLALPCRRLLVRVDDVSQVGRTRVDRLRSAPRFAARPTRCKRGVLVIDDVMTTGSTMSSAWSALMGAGYGPIALAVLARTPDFRQLMDVERLS